MVQRNLDYSIILLGILLGRTSMEFSFVLYFIYLYIILYFKTHCHAKEY